MNFSSSNFTEIFGCDVNSFLIFANEYYTPLLCLFGAVGNCLSIYVFFTTASHRSLTSSYYLSALAASDTGFLLNVFAFWLATVHGIDVITTSVSCPIIMYSGQVMGFLSVWFVVAFTVERFFAVCYPLTRPTVCTVTRARRVITGLSLVAITVSSYVLFIAEVVQVDDNLQHYNGTTGSSSECVKYIQRENSNISSTAMLTENYTTDEKYGNDNEIIPSKCYKEEVSFVCSVRKEYHKVSQIANYVDTLLTLILPFCAISFLNFRITLCVWKLKGQRETIVALSKLNRTSGMTTTSNKTRGVNVDLINNDGGRHAGGSGVGVSDSKNYCKTRNGPAQRGRLQSGNNSTLVKRGRATQSSAHRSSYTTAEVRVTKTLLLVSTVFLVFNLPSHAIRVVIFIKHTLLGLPIGCDWISAMEWANILFNTNFGVNFLLYCVSGRNFRKSLRNIFCRKNDERKSKKGLLTTNSFLKCPYSGKHPKQRKRNHLGENNRRIDGGKCFHPELEGMSGSSNQNPSIHSAGAFVSKTHESFFPTSVTEAETYA